MSLAPPRSQRPPSPSNTTFSGISNYKSESFRPIGRVPAVPPIDARKIARTHFDEIQVFLGDQVKEPQSSRASAREKLTRLTKQQFSELSTDVYDELMRRNSNRPGNEIPFLPMRQDFHPKRNQARQKLATLPIPRFKDLAGDVYFELSMRYPEFKEPEILDTPLSAPSTYDDAPSPDYRERSPPPAQSPVYSPVNTSRRNPSREQNLPYRRTSEDTIRSPDRKTSGRSGDDAGSSYGGGANATATSAVIIPTKSTIAEEEIKDPFAEAQASQRTLDDKDYLSDEDGGSAGYRTPTTPAAGLGGLSALSSIGSRQQQKDRFRGNDDDPGAARSENDFYDKPYGRNGMTSPVRNGSLKGKQFAIDEEKLRREYELKIATMQNKINSLEDEVAESITRKNQSEDRIKKLTEELELFRSRAEDQSNSMLSLRRELDNLRSTQSRERDAARAEGEAEIRRLKERCEGLERERDSLEGASSQHTMQLIEQLRTDLEIVAEEARELSQRNEELLMARETDSNLLRDLNVQMKEYKRKYEQSKTELRSLKATSQLYHSQPKPVSDDQLPVNPNGGLLDIHVTAFLSAIDLLLAAGRSATPSRVYSPMKSVINSVHAIIDDTEKYEIHARRDRLDVDVDDLQALRERAEVTLSNLATAVKTHGTSLGMSPVSLLDAAASHVSSTITEIGKTIHIRKATKMEQDTWVNPSSPTGMGGGMNGYRSMDEGNFNHLRAASTTSARQEPRQEPRQESRQESRQELRQELGQEFRQEPRQEPRQDEYGSPPRNGRHRELSPLRPAPQTPVGSRRPPSDPSTSSASSPPALFDKAPSSDGSVLTEQGDDGWLELKPYLEAQLESIMYSIQSVLSSVRNPTPSPNLNENLTQIITIVSSIVAVCKDSLPSASVKQGNDLLRQLSDHCDKLSEIQAQTEMTKESRQAMAKSSFAIANAMKSLVRI